MKEIKIAYSICGEGHGHYGRNVEILRKLAAELPQSEITLYTYGNTKIIFDKDKLFPKNILIKEIPGFRFHYREDSSFKSLGITLTNVSNWGVFLRVIKLDSLFKIIYPIYKFFSIFFKNKDITLKNFYLKHFDEFDFAITDLEPLLPRTAKIRNKPFITIDNQHILLYGKIDTKLFSFTEKIELFFLKYLLKIYHPHSDLFFISSFYNLQIKKRYRKFVKKVGPVIRKEIINAKKNIKTENFILVYVHDFLNEKFLSVLTEIDKYKLIIFSNIDYENKNFKYKRDWIEYKSIDPYLFIDYLTRCKAVISTAGHTLISESLYLKKPFFAASIDGNFEQHLNKDMLIKSDWGHGCALSQLDRKQILYFYKNIEQYKKNIQNSNIQNDTETIVFQICKKIKESSTKKQKINF